MILRKVWAHTVKTICLMQKSISERKNRIDAKIDTINSFFPFFSSLSAFHAFTHNLIHLVLFILNPLLNSLPFHFWTTSSLSFWDTLPGLIRPRSLLLISGMGELLRAMLDLHLISLQPSCCRLFQSLSLQDTDAVTVCSKLLFQQIETMR